MHPTSNFINLSIVELDEVTKQLLSRGLGFAPTTSSIPSMVVSTAMKRLTTAVKVYSYCKDTPSLPHNHLRLFQDTSKWCPPVVDDATQLVINKIKQVF